MFKKQQKQILMGGYFCLNGELQFYECTNLVCDANKLDLKGNCDCRKIGSQFRQKICRSISMETRQQKQSRKSQELEHLEIEEEENIYLSNQQKADFQFCREGFPLEFTKLSVEAWN